MRRLAAQAIAAASLVFVLASCGDDSDAGSPSTAPDSGEVSLVADDLVAGLCLARDQAAADPEAARATFFDTAHDPLHTVARELGSVDRGAAADVLQAKQRVEADFESADTALEADLGVLVEATVTGFATLGTTVEDCEDR